MKFFIAGRWTDRERVRELFTKVQLAGHSITRDWTIYEAPDNDTKFLRECALGDLQGVRDCDLFVLLADQEFQFRGAYAELGAAITLGKPCYIIGGGADKCIYVTHPLVRKIKAIEEVL